MQMAAQRSLLRQRTSQPLQVNMQSSCHSMGWCKHIVVNDCMGVILPQVLQHPSRCGVVTRASGKGFGNDKVLATGYGN